MSLPEHLRQSLDTTMSRVTQDVGEHLSELVQTWEAQASEERRAAVEAAQAALEADLERRVAEAVARARAGWDAEQQAALERVALDVEERVRSAQQAAAAVEGAAREAAEARLADAEQRLEAAMATWSSTEEQLQAELRVARVQAEEAVQALSTAERSGQAGERDAMLAGIERLLASIERLDGCTSLKATVDALAESVAAEALRSMVFVLRGTELRGWQFQGFPASPDPGSVRMPIDVAGPLGNAITRGAPVQIAPAHFEGPLAFAHLDEDRMGLVVPVVLGHATVAVVYVDDGRADDPMAPAGWPEVVQILARHASRHLEALTAARTVRLAGAQPRGWRGDDVPRGPVTADPAASAHSATQPGATGDSFATDT
jgi:hypothetical protein